MRSFGDIVRKLRYILTAKQKRQYVFVTIIAFIGSMWELLGVAAVLPFIETIMTPEIAEERWYTGLVIKYFSAEDPKEIMTILGLFIILLYLVKNLYLMFSSYVQAWYSTGVQRDLSIKMAQTCLSSSYLYHITMNSSVLIRAITQDVVGVFGVFFYLFRVIAEVFTITAISIYIITLDPLLALSLVVVLGSCMLLLFLGLKKLIRAIGRIGQECESRSLQYLSEAFGGIKEIMVMNRQKYFSRSFEDACRESSRAQKRNHFLNAIPANIYEVVCIGGLIGMVMIRLHMTDDVAGFLTKLATVAVAAFRLFPSVGRLTTNLNAITYNRNRLDTIYGMLKEINEDTLGRRPLIDVESAEPMKFTSELKAENVSFKYPASRDDVLKDLNFSVKRGQSVALIGPSGAGKTTLADVILGLLRPQKGHILLDGQDVYENLAGWSRLIGYVPQSVYLTDDTIRRNVAFGINEEDVDEERVWKALEDAQLADFVRGLEHGLDTMAGERGVALSGGQRQRIAIARALYSEPEILVLDEATSALDNETETAVMESIDHLRGSKTLIIVAHRLSTIRNCDLIYEISDGKAAIKSKEEVLG
ncbi:MAG: ABC transporter ATP-binding protein [Lachnospiraceae bacterium]|nr:ABC transporter ATP-binding protein [Lachnospiraceae bacterium]